MDSGKKFGLIIPQKPVLSKPKAKSVFESDSDDDSSRSKRPVIPQKKISLKNKIKEEALDPSIYEYDNIYDDMKAKQAESVAPKAKQSSRYIDTLLKAADKRKKEYERRVERKIQVEREKEGDQFKEKEEFVTAAYKQKMLEREEEEERERREAMLNDMMDVTKQKDLSGFYRHFLKQTVGEEKIPEFGIRDVKQEVVSDEEKPDKPNADDKSEIPDKDPKAIADDVNEGSEKQSGNPDYNDEDRDSDNVEIDTESDDNDDINRCRNSLCKTSSKRNEHKHLGKRKPIKCLDDDMDCGIKSKTDKKRQRKASSDNSGTDSDNSLSNDEIRQKQHSSKSTHQRKSKNSGVRPHSEKEANPKSKPSKQSKAEGTRHDSDSSDEDERTGEKAINNKENLDDSAVEKKERKNIYAKRTVGDVFIQAQTRYFQRMAARSS